MGKGFKRIVIALLIAVQAWTSVVDTSMLVYAAEAGNEPNQIITTVESELEEVDDEDEQLPEEPAVEPTEEIPTEEIEEVSEEPQKEVLEEEVVADEELLEAGGKYNKVKWWIMGTNDDITQISLNTYLPGVYDGTDHVPLALAIGINGKYNGDAVIYDTITEANTQNGTKLQVENTACVCVKKVGSDYVEVAEEESPITIERCWAENNDSLQFNINAKSQTVSFDDKYYIEGRLFAGDSSTSVVCRVPLEVKEHLVIPDPTIFCDTEEAAYQAIRDIIRNRTNEIERYHINNYRNYNTYVYERIAVDSNLYSQPDAIPLEKVCDFYEEREGMQPYEGDYIYNYLGDSKKVGFFFEAPAIFTSDNNVIPYAYAGGKTYYVYEIYLPVMTTKEQEDAVDAKVNELLNTTFNGYESWSTNQKIKAIYDYITKNVSGNVGPNRTTPIYHTAYSALIDGKGTCEAFALAFTRLSREMGVPSRVIMGTDSGAHTYNIVQINSDRDDWRYIDCSAGVYLTGKSFKRAAEQARFKDKKFVANYLNKIERPAPPINICYADSSRDFNTWGEAQEYMESLPYQADEVCTVTLSADITGFDMPETENNIPIRIASVDGRTRKVTYKGDETIIFTLTANLTLDNINLVIPGKQIDLWGYSLSISGYSDYASTGVFDSRGLLTSRSDVIINDDAKFRFLTAHYVSVAPGKSLTIANNGASVSTIEEMRSIGEGSVTIKKYSDTRLKIEDFAKNTSVSFATVDKTGKVIQSNNGTVLFNKSYTSNPYVEKISVLQPKDSKASTAIDFDAKKQAYVVGKYIITLSAVKSIDDPTSVSLSQDQFMDWNSVNTFINNEKAPERAYVIDLKGNVEIPSTVNAFASKVSHITVRSDNHASVTLSGKTTLQSDVTLSDVRLVTAKTSTVIDLNNHSLELETNEESGLFLHDFKIISTGNKGTLLLNSKTSIGEADIDIIQVQGAVSIDIYNIPKKKTVIGQLNFTKPASSIEVATGTDLTITQRISSADSAPVEFKRIANTGQPLIINTGELLYKTGKEEFDNSFIKVSQPESGDTTLLPIRSGNAVYAGKYYYTLKAGFRYKGDNGEPQIHSEDFGYWKDAIARADELTKTVYKNVEVSYEIVVNESIDIGNKLTYPKGGLTVSGKTEDVMLTFNGDIATPANVTFKDIKLKSTTLSPKLSTGAYTVTFENVQFMNTLASIAGSGKGVLTLKDIDSVTSNGAITAGSLVLNNTKLVSNNAGISIGNNTELTSATIDVKTAVSFKNLDSKDANNKIIYGTDYKNKFAISGMVNATVPSAEITAKTVIKKQDENGDPIEENREVKISDYAINILPRYLTDQTVEQYTNKDIITAKQAPACYFVIDRTEDNGVTSVKYATKKVGNALRLEMDPILKAVELFEVNGNTKCSWGTYNTLKEVFAEMDKSGSTSKEYLITIDPSLIGTIKPNTFKDDITTTAKARKITIQPVEGVSSYDLELAKKLVLKTNLTLNSINIADNITFNSKGQPVRNQMAVTLNNYGLEVNNSQISEDRISSIAGSDVKKDSYLTINNSGSINEADNEKYFVVTGNVDKVGTIKFDGQIVKVLGKTNVGNLVCTTVAADEDHMAQFIGSATLSTRVDKTTKEVFVKEVKSNITIANQIITNDMVGAKGVPSLVLRLAYKDSKKGYVMIDDSTKISHVGIDENVFSHRKPLYQVVKAPKAANKRFIYVDGLVWDGSDGENEATTVKKNGSIYFVKSSTLNENYSLMKSIPNEADPNGEPELEELATFETYAEVIAEIDTRADAACSYTICPLTAEPVAEKWTLPKPKCAEDISIVPGPNGENKLNFTNDKITANSNLGIYGMTIATNKPVNISYGQYILYIGDCIFEKNIGSIKGAGENKINKDGTINQVVIEGPYVVTGNVEKVGAISLSNTQFTVRGKMSVGTVTIEDGSCILECSASYKKESSKSKYVTSVTSNLTILNEIYRPENVDGFLTLHLLCKVGDEYVMVAPNDYSDIDNKVLDFTKTVQTAMPSLLLFKTNTVYERIDDEGPVFQFDPSTNLIRKNGAFYATNKIYDIHPGFKVWGAELNQALVQMPDNPTMVTGKRFYGTFETYSDAMNEIKNKIGYGDYIISANAELNEARHPVADYSIGTNKNIHNLLLTTEDNSALTMKYKGSSGMTLNIGVNGTLYLKNISFAADGSGNKPVNISIGQVGRVIGKDCYIDNLNNIKGGINSAIEFNFSNLETVQYYKGKMDVPVINRTPDSLKKQ